MMISAEGNQLVVSTPFNNGFVTELKTVVPFTARIWDNPRKVWIIAPGYGAVVAQLIKNYFGLDEQIPNMQVKSSIIEQAIYEVHYIGLCKDRGSGERSAFGYVDTSWKLIFPEKVLSEWFGVESRPGGNSSLYARLGIKRDAVAEEVKTAFRRMAKQWHPDVCREADAAQQFQAIQRAYEILSDPIKRGKYNAGLALQNLCAEKNEQPADGYRTPLRCGMMIVEYQESLTRFLVTKILAWEDIYNDHGQTLVSSWPMGATAPVEKWV